MDSNRRIGAPGEAQWGEKGEGAVLEAHESMGSPRRWREPRLRSSRPGRTPLPRLVAAITLIELIVVMGIMLMLASALVVASFRLQTRGQIEGTKGVLEQLAQGLEAYRITHRMYVPGDPGNASDISSWPLWYAVEYDGDYVTVADQYKEEHGDFENPATGAHVTIYRYVDAWGNPLVYECVGACQSFTLISRGKDLVLETGDDIVKE